MSDIARDASLSTPELLIAIFQYTDQRTLLVSALRVSRHWHALITTTPSLQRHLFFRPDRHATRIPGHITAKTQNPLLKDIFAAWFENTNSFTPRPAPGVNPKWAFPATAMMGYKRFHELPLFRMGGNSAESSPRWTPYARRTQSMETMNPFLRPEASWRRMLTSQPACHLVWSNAKRGPGASLRRDAGETKMTRYEDGLRMGEVYDIILRHSCSHQVSGFMVIWPEDGDEGLEHVTRHLRRMSGILPVVSAGNLREVLEEQPDLLVQMLWTEGQYRERDLECGDLDTFWEACGRAGLSELSS